ncbi:MAG: hypothetical protein KDD92_03645 [Caldilineaceae bacterium]|nr:hypothetical protein [Caldilineaceae bacterium]
MRIVGILLTLAVVLLAIQPRVAVAQNSEDDRSIPAVIMEQDSDIGRYTVYARVTSRPAADGVIMVEWTTAYETRNAGFNIVVADSAEMVVVNENLIPSTVIDSLEPQSYAATVTMTFDEFYLQHVTVDGQRYSTGPFIVGETVGEVGEPDKIDWAAIRAESDALAEEREAIRVMKINKMLDAVRGPIPLPDEPLIEQSAGVLGESSIFLPFVTGHDNGMQAAEAGAVDVVPGVAVNLLVEESSIYRVTYDDIAATGIDFSGVPSIYLALTNQGAPVRIRMVAAQNWGPGAYFEFIGERIDTLYTKQNVYVLQVDRSKAFRTYRNLRKPDTADATNNYYLESASYEENNVWFSVSPIDDPWGWALLNRTGSTAVSQTIDFDDITAIYPNQTIQLQLKVWGYTDGDHTLIVELNGVRLSPDISYSGLVAHEVILDVPAAALQNGANSLKLTVPASDSVETDAQAVEEFRVIYPRQFFVVGGSLDFVDSAKRYTVNNFPSNNIVIYSVYGGRTWRHEAAFITSVGDSYSAMIYGWDDEAQYYIADTDSVDTPVIQAGQVLTTDITNGSYDYLIISHPNFINAVEPLRDRRLQDGYRVKIVDVMDIYAQVGDGLFGIEPIQEYLVHAIQNMDVEYVLLVGDDVYDYHNSLSFIPTLYTEILTWRYAASDPILTDINNDGIPDAKIGRFPVDTVQEAEWVVEKTLNYAPNGPEPLEGEPQKYASVFAADVTFSDESQQFISVLPVDTWQSIVETAFLDDLSPTAAHDKLIALINDGTTIVSYLGHGVIKKWTASTNLFNSTAAANLSNADKAAIFLQWACYTSVYTSDSITSISETLLVSENRGAVATFGSTGITLLSSDRITALHLLPKLAEPGKTIGTAIQEANLAATAEFGYLREDTVHGLILLGDPTLVVTP